MAETQERDTIFFNTVNNNQDDALEFESRKREVPEYIQNILDNIGKNDVPSEDKPQNSSHLLVSHEEEMKPINGNGNGKNGNGINIVSDDFLKFKEETKKIVNDTQLEKKGNGSSIDSKIKEQESFEENFLIIENVPLEERTPELISEISKDYRYVFAQNVKREKPNRPPVDTSYGLYLIDRDNPEKIWSAQDVFQLNENIPSEKININVDGLINDTKNKIDPVLKEKLKKGEAVFYYDPEKTYQIFIDQLKNNPDSYLTILKDKNTGDIQGVTFAYEASLKEIFEKEEWENPLLFAGIEDPRKYRKYEEFEQKVRESLELKSSEPFPEKCRSWNVIFVNSECRKGGTFLDLIQNLIESLPEGKLNIPTFLELDARFPNAQYYFRHSPDSFIDTGYNLGSENDSIFVIPNFNNIKRILNNIRGSH